MRAIAGLRTDGGTSFCRDGGEHEWMPAWQQLVTMIRRDRTIAEEQHDRREGLRVALPVPRVNGQGELDFHEVESVKDFAGPRPLAEVTVDGPRRERLTFHIPDRAYIRLDERVDDESGEVQWRMRVEAKARELYADGLERWMSRWLGLATWWLTSRWPCIDELAGLGWRTTQWHLNADFVGFDIDDNDARRFVGVRKFSKYGPGAVLAEEKLRGAVDARTFESATSCAWVQTIVLGRKSSDSQLVVYRKGDQLREAKRVDPRASMYAPLWRANGWRPDDDGDPTRVELRLRKKGLRYQERIGGASRWDFRDPAALLSKAAVRELWWHHMHKRRLVAPEDATRKERARLDPRWNVVQCLGLPNIGVKQIPREVRELTRDERIARDVYGALQAAVRYAARSGVATPSYAEAGDALVAIGRRLQEGEARSLLAPLPAEPDLEAAVERAAATSQFFREQAETNRSEMIADLDAARGRPCYRGRVWEEEVEEDEGQRT